MHQLVGRLTALDPEASESLKVIAYFDALVDGHANADVLLRGAAVLSGCAAGFAVAGTQRRVDAAGIRSAVGSPAPADAARAGSPFEQGTDWPHQPLSDGGYAWIERAGPAHANDEMIVERLALSLGITLERSGPVVAARRAVETVLDATVERADRLAAAARLKLDATGRYRVVATPASAAATHGQQTVTVTRVGAVRAVIRPADAAPGELPTAERAGLGYAVSPGDLDRSWSSALLALRMTSPREPVVAADDLGAVLMLAEAADERPDEHPDVRAVKRVMGSRGSGSPDSSASTHELVEALVATGSARATARELGLHHSTVQSRVAELSKAVGFDVRTMQGQTRLGLALRLYYVATNVFD